VKTSPELLRLRRRLAEANATLRAIRLGEVDAVVVTGKQGEQVFTLKGAEHAYRLLIESMNEGALTLSADKTILYANSCFARMIKCPLEQLAGSSFRRFLSLADQATFRPFVRRAAKSGAKIQLSLLAGDGAHLPVQISIRELAAEGSGPVTIGLVVTDMTEAHRTEELLRALTHRVVQVQEAERSQVAQELHDNITQLLCAVLFSSQALSSKLSRREGPAKREATKLRELLEQTASEVERISRNLRPGILDQLDLFSVLGTTCSEFAARSGTVVRLAGASLNIPLPAETELALYRILQEALKNVEQHARARRVMVSLRLVGAFVQLVITDDGIGFDAVRHAARRKGKAVLGLVGMRERAAYVGGTLTIKSGPRAGTEITVLVPLPPAEAAA
jgi:two-component system NarL family sensor kinase